MAASRCVTCAAEAGRLLAVATGTLKLTQQVISMATWWSPRPGSRSCCPRSGWTCWRSGQQPQRAARRGAEHARSAWRPAPIAGAVSAARRTGRSRRPPRNQDAAAVQGRRCDARTGQARTDPAAVLIPSFTSPWKGEVARLSGAKESGWGSLLTLRLTPSPTLPLPGGVRAALPVSHQSSSDA